MGYLNLNINISDKINLTVSQESFDTTSCKYETTFPTNKILYISEIIVC
jgi:hypothetical protein